MAILFLVNGIVLGSWLPRLPEIRDRLDLGLAEVGLTLAVGGIGGLVGSAVSGMVVGAVGPRRSAIVPGLTLMALLPLVAVAPTAVALAAVMAVIAVVDSVADVGMNAVAVRVEAARGRSIFSRLHGVWSLGSLLGAAASTIAVATGVALEIQLMVTAGAGMAAVAWAARLLPEPEANSLPRAPKRRRVVVSLALAGAGAAFLEGTPSDWSALFLTDVLGSPPAIAGAGFLGLSLGMMIGRFGGDAVVDRMGARFTLMTGLIVVAMAVALATAAVSVPLTLTAFTVWGLGVSVVLPLLYRQAGSHPALGEGSGLAALTLGSRVGFLAGPAAVGSVADVSSLPIAIVVVMGVALAVSVSAIFASLQH
ncbi:MAG: MFS transporter [Acidimicrobiia bacterium]